MLGHLEVKCGEKQGVRYGSEVVRSFENWLKRVPGFREAVNARQQQTEEVRSAKIGEYLKIAIETVDKKNRPGATTQLNKPRFPSLWSGQKYDRWKIEGEKWCDNNKAKDEEKYID